MGAQELAETVGKIMSCGPTTMRTELEVVPKRDRYRQPASWLTRRELSANHSTHHISFSSLPYDSARRWYISSCNYGERAGHKDKCDKSAGTTP